MIHFNFGIWDTHLLDAEGNLVAENLFARGHSPQDAMSIRHTPEQYVRNLAALVEILQSTGARLIWASTTPVLFRTGERLEAIPLLNRLAVDLMAAHCIPINDLYAFVLPHAASWQDADQCHFNALGNRELGERVAATIRRAL